MSNALTTLLETESTKRTVDDYERTFDDFIAFAGGKRIRDLFEIPKNTLNADYLVEIDGLDLIVELKQINQYEKGKSVDQYFESLIRSGRALNVSQLSATQIRIDPRSLTISDWNHFYRKFRPSVARHLDKAAQQLRSTATFLPSTDRRRAYGVIFVNTGDFNLPVDLLHRLVEFHSKRKWKAGRFSHLDFVVCVMMDMVKPGQHPLHGRCLVRSLDDEPSVEGARHLFDRWIRYGAAAIGAEVEFHSDAGGDTPLDLSGGVAGKIVKTASTQPKP